MRKKIICLGLALSIMTGSAIAAQTVNFGLMIGNNGYSDTSDVVGGYYLKSAFSAITLRLMLNVEFETNILSNTYQDSLLSASCLARLTSGDTFGLALGPAVLCDLKDLEHARYLGLTIAPLNSWTSQFQSGVKMYMCFLPTSIYYGYVRKEFLWAFNFVEIRIFF